jgi:hypothetical protein
VSIRNVFPIALSLIACCAAGTSAAVAQTSSVPTSSVPASSVPAKPPSAAPAHAAPDATATHPMQFYRAHGEANACGPGCSDWIAAEGKIDNGTANRLQRLLLQLNGAPPPIFFHSPGGLVMGSMDLGRLIRAHKMTVSVGRTIPLSCERGATGEKSCEAQINAGRPIEAELSPLGAMCNSGCVYELAGGVVRLIPPWITLGIHDIGVDPATAKIRQTSPLALEAAKLVTDGRLHNYIRLMGIDDGLLTEAFATPFSSVRPLTRDDAARFGLDRREFAETAWQFVEKPQATIRKTFFVRADDGERRYVNAMVDVSCAQWLDATFIMLFARERLNSDTEIVAGQPTASISVNGRDVHLARTISTKFYQRIGPLPQKALEAASDDTTVVVPGTEFRRRQGPSGDVTLAMVGFSAAYAKLQKACAQETEQARSAQAASGLPPLPSLAPSPLTASALPPPRAEPIAIGASRALVDATIGAPTQTIGSTALYSYMSSANESKVMAGYFDRSGHLQRFARYVLKDGKVFDEIGQIELSEGQELAAVRRLLATPNGPNGSGRAAALPGWRNTVKP